MTTQPRLAQIHQSGATDGQIPVWDATLGRWIPGDSEGGSGTSGSVQVTEDFTLGASGAQTKTLHRTPVGVPVVSLNGLVQRQTDEWTISGAVLSVLTGMAALSGDVLQATYHPDPTIAPAAESPTSTVTVVDDTTHNAFPGLAVAGDGTLVISYRTGSGHATGVGVAKVKRSTDDGATWGSAITVYSGANDFRDPVVANTPYGLMVTGFDYTGSTFPGLRVHVSTDNGLTWSQLAHLTTVFSDPNNASSAPIVTLSDGTLLWPVYGTDTGDTVGKVKVLASTDGGVTWTVRAVLYNGSVEFVEPNICALDDGSLLMMIRSDTGTPTLYRSVSTDQGATWSTPAASLTCSGRPAIIELWGRTHLGYRVNGTGQGGYAYSDDGGATWTPAGTFTGTSTFDYACWADTGGLRPSVAWAEETSLSNADVFFRRVPV